MPAARDRGASVAEPLPMPISIAAGSPPTLRQVHDELVEMTKESHAIEQQKAVADKAAAFVKQALETPFANKLDEKAAPRDALFKSLTDQLAKLGEAAAAIPAAPVSSGNLWNITYGVGAALDPSYAKTLGSRAAADFAAVRNLPGAAKALRALGREDLLPPIEARLQEGERGVAEFGKRFTSLVDASRRTAANNIEAWITGGRSARLHPDNHTTIRDVFGDDTALLQAVPELGSLDLHDALLHCAQMLRDGKGDALVKHKRYYTSDSPAKVARTTAGALEAAANHIASGRAPSDGVRFGMVSLVVGRNAEREGPLMDFLAAVDQAMQDGTASLANMRYAERT
jgi:hypothetical protein